MELPGKVTVEVAHEALIRKWTRLREWVDKDRDGLRIHDGFDVPLMMANK